MSIRRIRIVPRSGCLLLALVVFAGCTGDSPSPPSAGKGKTGGRVSPDADPVGKTLAGFNRGAALMEQYRYREAAQAFEEVVARQPDWIAARFNLGLARFNLHGQAGAKKSLDEARKCFQAVLDAVPTHLHARFCLGLYHQHLGENEKALSHFEAVHDRDPDDPFAAYKCAETLIGLGRHEDAVRLLEKIVALDPGFVSATYRLALQYRRMHRSEKAGNLFKRFRALQGAELTGGSFAVGKVYGSAGKYYMVLGADNLPLPRPGPAANPRVIFAPEIRRLPVPTHAWKWAGGAVDLPGMAAGDVDGDGDLDLCLTALGRDASTSIWLNDGSGGFSAGQAIGEKGVSPCFGDVDNDGDLDLWLGCVGSDVLLESDGKGNFTRSQALAPTASAGMTPCARLLDIDSDGDLDCLAFRCTRGSVPARGPHEASPGSVHNNNRDGTFQDLASKLGLALEKTPVVAVVHDDLDNDRDLDLAIFPAGSGRPIVWVNDRLGKYRILDAESTGLSARGVLSATSGDPDKDGDRDLLVFTESGVQLHLNQGGMKFRLHRDLDGRSAPRGGTGGQFADMDNDGDLDIVIADAYRRDGSRGPVLLVNDLNRHRYLDASELDPGNLLAEVKTGGDASCVVADFTGNGRCDVLLASPGEKPRLVENVTPGGHWIQLDLRGTRKKDNKARSNGSAVGARVEVKTGRVLQQFVVGAPAGPAAMGPLRIHAGLGGNPKVDWLRILWPDAVLQAELEIAADRVMTVTELPRKTSSCPYLFAWDGARFSFVADFGGVGGLGYLIAPGTYAPPDPTEYLSVPHLKPRDGHYVLQALTPLEEITYFDEARLIAVDHPAGTEVHPNEMMAVGVPPPDFEVFCYRRPIDPVRVVDHRGTDVTEKVLRLDRRHAGPTDLDPRFTGLAAEHFVELDFGDRLAGVAMDSRLVLFLYGWVEYGYSTTNFASHQAGLRVKAPSIHVWRGGKWIEIFHEVGYPAGVNHMMTLDVTGKIRPGDRRVRIATNMELYWDRIFLAVPLGEGAFSLREVPAGRANLHFRGYPREYTPDGRHPDLYDYDHMDTATAWKLMAGNYTRYGDVTELLEAADDCYAIMGHGEELTLSFPVEAFGPVPAGRRRSFILKTDSFCKDMDLYTAHGDTVAPLPFHAMSGYPYGPDENYPDTEKTRDYRRRYNTRRVCVPTGASPR